MSRIGLFFFFVASIGASFAAATDKLVDDVPIPADVRIEVARDAPEGLSRFSGAWVGSWRGLLHHILIVENISASGEARVVYAIGSDAFAGVTGQWRRLQATVSTDMLTITAPSAFSTAPGDTFSATYVLTPADSLRATYRRGDVIARATLSRIAVDELMLPGPNVAWTTPGEFLNTTLQEGGKPVAGPIRTCSRKPTRARRSPTFSWTEVGWLRFPSAAAEANRMVFTMRVSRPTARRDIPAILIDRCPVLMGRWMTSRRRSLPCNNAWMSPPDPF
jgi:hypothetical protein